MGGTSSLSNLKITGELAGPTGTGITQTVGHAVVAEVTYTGADVSTNLADCTTGGGTISAPGAWTDLVDFNIGTPIKVFIVARTASSVYSPVIFTVDSGEDTNDAIRVQILVDGNIIWDQRVTDSAGDATVYVAGDYQTAYLNTGVYRDVEFNCNSSFKLRATRNGTFANADTTIVIGASHYIKYQ